LLLDLVSLNGKNGENYFIGGEVVFNYFASDNGKLFENDVCIIKKYGNRGYKITLCHRLRKKGFEVELTERSAVNAKKLDNNISRARNKIFEYAYCNEWDYFVTLTIDKDKYDRSDLKTYYKDFSQFLRDCRKKYNSDIQYLFIPELHADGVSWHMHGFLKGLSSDALSINSNGYLDWFDYRKKFGYISMDKIRNTEACAKYITKYVSKKLSDCVTELNAKMYYCSRGLQEAEEIKRGFLKCELKNPDFENDYCKIKWVSDVEELPKLTNLL
jgi:hypothetical protein